MTTILSAANVRAGRGLLGWNQKQLAEAADVSVASIKRIEQGTETTPVVENAVLSAFSKNGVVLYPSANDIESAFVEASVALVRK